jgi:hypothetical protein
MAIAVSKNQNFMKTHFGKIFAFLCLFIDLFTSGRAL